MSFLPMTVHASTPIMMVYRNMILPDHYVGGSIGECKLYDRNIDGTGWPWNPSAHWAVAAGVGSGNTWIEAGWVNG